MRLVESCSYRRLSLTAAGAERVGCGLAQQVLMLENDELCAVARSACEFCCRGPEPTASSLNQVVASLIYVAAARLKTQNGLPDDEAARVEAARSEALRHLPREDSDLRQKTLEQKHEGPCYSLGKTTGLRDCPTCRGSVRLKVYECAHLLHGETTLAECARCEDHEPRLKPGGVKRWAVGVTTAPRLQPTLERCLESLVAAGWETPRIFAEPDVSVPAQFAHWPITRRDAVAGAWPNWYLGLAELYQRQPTADAYLMVQDDALFCRNVRGFLEAELWPDGQSGVVSVYCPEPYGVAQSGWTRIERGVGLIGALAFILPNPAVRSLLAHPGVVNHRRRGRHRGLMSIDSVVGRWAEDAGHPVHYLTPSLVQHIGETSTLWPTSPNEGKRRSTNFVSDQFDALGLVGAVADRGNLPASSIPSAP